LYIHHIIVEKNRKRQEKRYSNKKEAQDKYVFSLPTFWRTVVFNATNNLPTLRWRVWNTCQLHWEYFN